MYINSSAIRCLVFQDCLNVWLVWIGCERGLVDRRQTLEDRDDSGSRKTASFYAGRKTKYPYAGRLQRFQALFAQSAIKVLLRKSNSREIFFRLFDLYDCIIYCFWNSFSNRIFPSSCFTWTFNEWFEANKVNTELFEFTMMGKEAAFPLSVNPNACSWPLNIRSICACSNKGSSCSRSRSEPYKLKWRYRCS